MTCSFSGRNVPTEKLFVLYYPPAAAHETWDKSFYAAARAREAVAEARLRLKSFFPRHVATRKAVTGLMGFLAGLALVAYWGLAAYAGWAEMAFPMRYLLPLPALFLLLVGHYRLRGFFARWRGWRRGGRETAARELAAIDGILADLPEDPDAEEAAAIMRREFPADLSELAFHGANFRAFTYMDFVLSPKLRHPTERNDLPGRHSFYRDAYYVGEIVYDNWRMFQKDRRTTADPRFVGSGGQRGVI